MKGNKKRIAGIICAAIGVLGLPSVSTVEKDRFGYIVVCLAFIAVGGLLIYSVVELKSRTANCVVVVNPNKITIHERDKETEYGGWR